LDNNQHTRIKVNKSIDKRIVIFKLRANYLGLFALIAVLFGLILMVSFSIKTLAVIITFLVIVYLVIQYLDTIDFLENRKKSQIPDELYNDLY